MLRDSGFRFKHLGGVSKVKSMFSLLVYLLVTMVISYLLKSLMNVYKIRLGSKLPYFFPWVPPSISSFNSAMTLSLFCLCRDVSWQDSLNWFSIIVFSSFLKSSRTSFLTCFNFAYSYNLFTYVNESSIALPVPSSESISISLGLSKLSSRRCSILFPQSQTLFTIVILTWHGFSPPLSWFYSAISFMVSSAFIPTVKTFLFAFL